MNIFLKASNWMLAIDWIIICSMDSSSSPFITLSYEISMLFGEITILFPSSSVSSISYLTLSLKTIVMYILLTLSHLPGYVSTLTKTTRLAWIFQFPFLSMYTPVIFELGNPSKNRLCEGENNKSIFLSFP
jgi:hypothetical protein